MGVTAQVCAGTPISYTTCAREMNCSIASDKGQFCFVVLISARALVKPVCKQGWKYLFVFVESLFIFYLGSHIVAIDYSLLKSIATKEDHM